MKVLAAAATGVAASLVGAGVTPVLFSLAVLGSDEREPGAVSEHAVADIPAELLPIYQGAARTCQMRWAVLAAVGKIEGDHGRSESPGVRSGANGAGAMGPMQFLRATWAAYGIDANGDGMADVYDPVDAIWGAANYLCANGAGEPSRLRSAIWHYNHDDWYVDDVLELASAYEVEVAGGGEARYLVDDPNLSLTPRARQDLLDGVVDQRVLDFLAWAVERHTISVSVLRTGHARYVAGTTRISDHSFGRAVDIYAVDGELVSADSAASRAFAIETLSLAPPGRPSQVGFPWQDLTNRPGAFSDADHLTHLHMGWSPEALPAA